MASLRFSKISNPSTLDSEALPDPPRVLVASASKTTRQQIGHRLRQRGYSVVESRSGLEILDQVDPRSAGKQSIDRMIMEEVLDGAERPRLREPVDLVVLDVSQNTWAGLALLEAVRRHDWALPAILLTDGEGTDTIRGEARRLGVQKMLTRPVDPDRVADAVQDIEPPAEQLAWCA